jgi:16S rRNA (guanine527-N7)-methyltransferase
LSDVSKNSANSPTDATVSQWRIPVWFTDLDVTTLKNLKVYFDELVKFNKVINLISPKTLPNADAIHFADSILSCRFVFEKMNKNNTIHDLGSGNGFPGLVFSILYPQQKVVLMDSDERKCEFLKHVIKTIGLTNVEVQNKKIDLLPSDSIKQAICRGFAPLPKVLLMLRKIVSKDGMVFHLKSEEWAMEVSQIPSQLCSVWQPKLAAEYRLPVGDVKMFVVETEKIA